MGTGEKKILGTDGYRVPEKFSLMPTPDRKEKIASMYSNLFWKFIFDSILFIKELNIEDKWKLRNKKKRILVNENILRFFAKHD